MYFLIRLLRILLFVGIGYLLYKVLWKGESLNLFKRKKRPHPQKEIQEMKKDPICGTYIPENQAVKYKSHGETHYFCSEECKEKFEKINKGSFLLIC